MSPYLGDFLAGKKVFREFATTSTAGAPTTLTTGSVAILKDGVLVTPSGGVTLATDANGTGSHQLTVDMSVDTTTFAAGHDYAAYLSGSSAVGATSVVGTPIAQWSVDNRSINVDANGNVNLVPAQSGSVQSGTAQAGAATSITLAAGASATNNLYNGSIVRLTGGTGAGQARTITGYVGSTKVATVDYAWAVAPDSTTTYSVIADDRAALNSSLQPVASAVAGNVAGSVASVTGPVGSVTAGVTVTTNNDKTGYSLSIATLLAIASQIMQGIAVTSTVNDTSPTTTSFKVQTGLPNTVVGSGCLFTGTSVNAGTELIVTGYNSGTGQLTVSGGYANAPANGDTCAFVGRLA